MTSGGSVLFAYSIKLNISTKKRVRKNSTKEVISLFYLIFLI